MGKVFAFIQTIVQKLKNLDQLLADLFKWLTSLGLDVKASTIIGPEQILESFDLLRELAQLFWVKQLEKIGFIAISEDKIITFVHKGEVIFEGTKKEAKLELASYFKNSKKERKSLEKYLDEVVDLRRLKFIFKGFAPEFVEHLERGHIKIKIKHVQTGEIKDTYKYATGKGGKSINEISHPWQAKKEISGIHMYSQIDGNLIRIRKIVNSKTLHTGEKVIIAELEVFVKELNQFSKKSKTSTLWPQNWSLKKIKRITEEASENVVYLRGRKYRGISKQGYEVEFFSETKGVIENAYIYTKNLK